LEEIEMTQRFIEAGTSPTVIVHAGGDVQIEGCEGERLFASTQQKRGLKLERGNESALGHIRARARVGNRVLFDANADLLRRRHEDLPDDAIRVQSGGDVLVRLPFDSTLKVYGGRDVEVRAVRGAVTAYAGRDLRVHNVQTLAYASAGGAMDLDCGVLAGEDVTLSAGRDMRFHVRELRDATIGVDDLGGYWEAVVGEGARRIRLQAGGDVVLVTDQPVRSASPNGLLGQIEPPPGGEAEEGK
jgi:hypothetical protein